MQLTLEENDDLLTGGGAEGSETEEDIGHDDPTLLARAVVTGTDWAADTILKQLEKGNIALDPVFQRRDAWDEKRKSRFIKSRAAKRRVASGQRLHCPLTRPRTSPCTRRYRASATLSRQGRGKTLSFTAGSAWSCSFRSCAVSARLVSCLT
jgi:hypothetical protein